MNQKFEKYNDEQMQKVMDRSTSRMIRLINMKAPAAIIAAEAAILFERASEVAERDHARWEKEGIIGCGDDEADKILPTQTVISIAQMCKSEN